MATLLPGFSPDSFEQLIRALALKIFGHGVTVFGNGPDGGREATFNGRVPFPVPGDGCWAGYGVIQAKFKEKPETTQKDQAWALSQLKAELNSFINKRKKLPKPEYYVYCTNVELSSAAGGGKDQADKILKDSPLNLKDFRVWDANQIKAHIDGQEEIRKRFAQFLTTGDLLVELLNTNDQQKKRIPKILESYLDRELRGEKLAKLDQAGDRAETALPVARIFIDLPITLSRAPQTRPEQKAEANGRTARPGILAKLLHASNCKLDPTSLSEAESNLIDASSDRIPSTFILVGGPGSGKSTITQCLAQVNRAALLSRIPESKLIQQTREIISNLRRRLEEEGLAWPITPRYPLRIDLNRFAKKLAEGKSASLTHYLAEQIAGDVKFGCEDLLQTLETLPFIAIFDGLDEVPVTSNRDKVLETISNFLADARRQNCDLLVVATTRPQGYQGEFRDQQALLCYFDPLPRAKALSYTKLYAETRFGANDPNRARQLTESMEAASKNTLIEPLLVSPLQVTFMVTILAAQGEPSEGRWHLFKSYYDTIYSRELQKSVPSFQVILQSHRTLIDLLHFEIGFLLQLAGETDGKSGASLRLGYFKLLVEKKLKEKGISGSERQELVESICGAALERLVFLTARTADELSFEVRSLQEFMASQCLMTGPDSLREARLRETATSPYWRNVWLFAAGQCFGDAQLQHLSATVRLICADLNISDNRIISITETGSWLALDLLEGRIPATDRIATKYFFSLALPLLKTAIDDEEFPLDVRLSRLFTTELLSFFYNKVEAALAPGSPQRNLPAARLVIRLAQNGEKLALELLSQLLDREPLAARVYALELIRLDNSDAALKRFESLERITPLRIEKRHRVAIPRPVFSLATGTIRRHESQLRIAINQSFEVTIQTFDSFAANFGEFLDRPELPQEHQDWKVLRSILELSKVPTCAQLATCLRGCIDCGFFEDFILGLLPWPLATILETQRDLNLTVSELISSVEAGKYGTPSAWAKANGRWKANGLALSDFRYASNCKQCFDEFIGEVGVPRPSSWSISPRPSGFEAKSIAAIAPHALKLTATWTEFFSLLVAGAIRNLKVAESTALLTTFWKESKLSYIPLLILNATADPAILALDAWSLSRRKLKFFPILDRGQTVAFLESLKAAFNANNLLFGLLRCLGAAAAAGQKVDLPDGALEAAMNSEVHQVRLAAVFVRLSSPGIDEDAGALLGQKAIDLICPECELRAIVELLELTERSIKVGNQLEGFLLTIYDALREADSPEIIRCEALLRLALTQRPSPLQDSALLEQLQLPSIPPASKNAVRTMGPGRAS